MANELSVQHDDLAADIGTTDETSWTPPANMTYDSWVRVGRTLQQVHRSVNFWIGDWLCVGERRFGEIANQAVEETGHGVESLLKCKAVAFRYKPEQRKPELSWSHHLAAAYIDEDLRDQVLCMAVRYEISTRDLKAIIAMPVRLVGDLLRAYRDNMALKGFYRLLEIKRVEAAEWDRMVVNDEPKEETARQLRLSDSQEGSDDEELPFDDAGEPEAYDWSSDLEQNIEAVFTYFEHRGVPLKLIYTSEAVWEGMSVRAALDSEGQPLLVWEVVP